MAAGVGFASWSVDQWILLITAVIGAVFSGLAAIRASAANKAASVAAVSAVQAAKSSATAVTKVDETLVKTEEVHKATNSLVEKAEKAARLQGREEGRREMVDSPSTAQLTADLSKAVDELAASRAANLVELAALTAKKIREEASKKLVEENERERERKK